MKKSLVILPMLFLVLALMPFAKATEYQVGDSGKVFAQVLDKQNKPINNALCNTTIYYPNSSKFVNSLMTFLENGNYYYNFTIPSVLGTYAVNFNCSVPNKAFTQVIPVWTTLQDSETYTGQIGFNDMDNMTISDKANLTIGITYGSIGTYFNGYNLGSSATTKTYLIDSINFAVAGFQSFALACYNYGGICYITQVTLNAVYNPISTIELVKGQTEIHVSNISSGGGSCTCNCNLDIIPIIGNLTNVNNTIKTYISSVNNTDSGNLVCNAPTVGDIWEYAPRNLSYYELTVCPSNSDIWQYEPRNLTYYQEFPFNDGNIINNITNAETSINIGLISVNNTIKNINSTIIFPTIPNITVNYTEIARVTINRLIEWKDIVFPRGIYLW